VIPDFWEATKYQGRIHAIAQDSESRMIFFNKDHLRKIGKDEAFIAELLQKVQKGEFLIWGFSKHAQEVRKKGVAQFGLLHRPTLGPESIMTFAAIGVKRFDERSGKLVLPRKELGSALS